MVSKGTSETPFRPCLVDNDDVVWNAKLKNLVCSCWSESPTDRPSFSDIQKFFQQIFKYGVYVC